MQPWLQITDEDTGEEWNITGCPFASLNSVVMEYVRWYGFYQKGWLPVEGGLLDQSNLFIEVMEYIDYLVNAKGVRDADERRVELNSAVQRSSNRGG